MKVLPLILLLSSTSVLGVLQLPTAHAASFDCSRAGSANEKAICRDAELSALDDQLGRAYRRARQAATDVRAFRSASDAQWRWREDKCHDRDCLLAWYQRRQGELEALAAPAGNDKPTAAAGAPAPALAAVTPPQAQPVALPATPALRLGLDARQIDHLAPAGSTPWPHYARAEHGQYFYRDPDAGETQPLVAVRYYGMENGQHILEAVRGQTVLRYTCSADCRYIARLALPGDVEKDTVIVSNDRASLPSLIVADALNGLLAPVQSR